VRKRSDRRDHLALTRCLQWPSTRQAAPDWMVSLGFVTRRTNENGPANNKPLDRRRHSPPPNFMLALKVEERLRICLYCSGNKVCVTKTMPFANS
jgi:hypothetical protein